MGNCANARARRGFKKKTLTQSRNIRGIADHDLETAVNTCSIATLPIALGQKALPSGGVPWQRPAEATLLAGACSTGAGRSGVSA